MKTARSFSPAIWTALLVTSLSASAAAAVEPEPSPEEREHFKTGVALGKKQRYAEALREFNAAYAISQRLSVLFNIARASERLERDGPAIDAYREYLERGGTAIGNQEAARVRRTLEQLQASLAVVKIEAPGTFWVVDTRTAPDGPIVNEYGPFDNKAELRLRSGQHELGLERARIDAPAWLVTLNAGDVASHSFAVEPETDIIAEFDPVTTRVQPDSDEEPPKRSHTVSYVLWGTAAAGTLATTVFLLEAHGLQNDADDDFARRCPSGATGVDGCDSTTAGSTRAARWRTGALLTGIGALGALATGTVLYFLDSPERHASERANEARVRPWVSPTSIGVSGTF